MWGHYLLTLYRSLTRHWLYAALNVMGLAVGIAVFLVLSLLVRFETSYDRWLPNADNVYRISSTYTFPGRAPDVFALSAGAILPALRTDYPQVDGVRLMDSQRPVQNGSILGSEQMDYVDSSFFDVLDLPLASGDRHTALGNPDDAVVTEAIALKYFGSTAVVGHSLTLFYHGVPRVHRITAVLKDIPFNSHLRLGIVAPLSSAMIADPDNGLSSWGRISSYTYLRFRNPATARAVAADLPRFIQQRAHDSEPQTGPDITKNVLRLNLVPVPALHFADARLGSPMKAGADARLVYALGLVGSLTLVIAILNYVNLATARSALRAKEIALRKVMGATRRALMIQLLIEALAFSFLAILVGLALAELALPMVNTLGGAPLKLAYWGDDSVLPWAIGLAVVIGLGAGLYPALLLSRFEPASVLASTRAPGGGKLETQVRAVLIGAQFAAAIVFTICTLVIGSQAQFIRDADRGFRRDGLILLDNVGAVLLAQRQNELLDTFRRVPGVVAATASYRTPGQTSGGLIFVHRSGQKGPATTIEQDLVADGYLKTFGAGVVAGRMFDHAHGLDDVGGPDKGASDAAARGVGVMLNERAVRSLGFTSAAQAVGQRVFTEDGPGTAKGGSVPIIGVLRDVQFGSPQHPVAPVIYRYDSQPFGGGAIGAIRYTGVGDAEMMERLQTVWRRVAPTVPFLGKTAESSLSDFYVPDEQRARLFTLGSVLAVAIGCVGLYGLAAFNTARRFKEIGIRKTLGASTFDILKLVLLQILRPVVVANLVAWPIAYVAMRAWLSSFDQRIALSPLFFITASVLALVVASLTVIAQSLRLARSEPAKALHHE
jgi:putative ABC transport system permease protein